MEVGKRFTSFVIEGDTVKEMSKTLVSEVKIDDFMESIKQDIPISTGILPRGSIFYHRSSMREVPTELFVLELTPKCTSIRYKGATRSSTGTEVKLRLSLPFVGVLVKTRSGLINDAYVYCTKKRVTTLNDPIFVLPLPNTYDQGSGKLCYGDLKVDNKEPMHDQIAALIKSFFSSQFNNDLLPDIPPELRIPEGDIPPSDHNPMQYALNKWADLTKKNSLVGITDDIKYKQHSRLTLLSLLKANGYKEGSDEH